MLLNEIRFAGLLSFGPKSPPLTLGSLNLFVGTNGSGKSNFIDGLDLLRSSATKFAKVLRGSGGGVGEWIWKGAPKGNATISASVTLPDFSEGLSHKIVFRVATQYLELMKEVIAPDDPSQVTTPYPFYYRSEDGFAEVAEDDFHLRNLRRLDPRHYYINDSILSQLRDPEHYPRFTSLARAYESIRMYREWSFGRSTIFRVPQSADLPGDRLEEDFSNLGLFLNHLRSNPNTKKLFLAELKNLYSGIDDFDVRVKGGTVEVFLTEGNYTIPASRLSDGTLRYLALLAILCDPNPPAVVCIEEPELGLHPDLIPRLADLLVSASERTQIIVTTHSDILVDSMTERPDCVVVFEKNEGSTETKRLNKEDLRIWLKDYRLGQLWTSGQIGGVRW